MTDTGTLCSFESMVKQSGKIAAMNAYFAANGNLPEEKTRGEYYEALGDPKLGEEVEAWIKSNCSR